MDFMLLDRPQAAPETLEVDDGHAIVRIGGHVPSGGVAVDPGGRVRRYEDHPCMDVERIARYRWPFIRLGFDVVKRCWCWYRVDREAETFDVGDQEPAVGGYVNVVTIIQGCFTALWETNNCDRENTVVHEFRMPSQKIDLELLEFIEQEHPQQFENITSQRWVGQWLRRDYLKKEARRAERCHVMATEVVREWSHFVDMSNPERFKRSVVVPDWKKE